MRRSPIPVTRKQVLKNVSFEEWESADIITGRIAAQIGMTYKLQRPDVKQVKAVLDRYSRIGIAGVARYSVHAFARTPEDSHGPVQYKRFRYR